jgi:hypothetical protein
VDQYDKQYFKEFSKGFDILVSMSWFCHKSLGNSIVEYFESIFCAEVSGLHYYSLQKFQESEFAPFFDFFPKFIMNSKPTSSFETALKALKTKCICLDNCHENPNALWVRKVKRVSDMIRTALEYHIEIVNAGDGIESLHFAHLNVTEHDFATQPVGSILPFLPDVSIHYRSFIVFLFSIILYNS